MLSFDQHLHDGNYILNFGQPSLRRWALVERNGVFTFLCDAYSSYNEGSDDFIEQDLRG